jgi:serine/threonine-protein kinase
MRFERGRPLAGAPVVAAPASVRVAAPVTGAAVAAAPAPAPRHKRGRWGPVVVIGIALALLVGLIVFLLANSDFGGGTSSPKLDVPPAVGVPYGQAAAALEAKGFKVARKDVDEPQQAPDLVLGQDPESGRKIDKGGLITLTVSSPTIAVPNVVGQAKGQATQTLAARNLTANFTEEDSDQPPGTVLRTDPAAGGAVAKLPQGGSPSVSVVIARIPLVPVPAVAGQDPFAAGAALSGAGFQVTVAQEPNDTVAKGAVIRTDPAEGTPLPRGSAVTLYVSSGPNLVNVPSLIGQTRATAEAVLHDQLGFGLTITLVNAGPTKKGLVVSQSPAGGQAAKGSAILLVVGI